MVKCSFKVFLGAQNFAHRLLILLLKCFIDDFKNILRISTADIGIIRKR